MYYEEQFKEMIGAKVSKIFFNEDCLKFDTDKGPFVFNVDGDCCSYSYFHDFIGVKKLLENGPIVSTKEIELDLVGKNRNDSGEIECYGFELVTEHPTFGEQTSVFSFRNSSNGYYGGMLVAGIPAEDVQPEIFDDVIEAAEYEPLTK